MNHYALAIIVYLLLLSTSASAWTINADFEDGTVGNQAKGLNAFSGPFKYTKYTDIVKLGKLAAKVGIDSGTTGFGEWGGSFIFPSPLIEGDEIWFRLYVYLPNDFDYTATGAGMKMMRIHTASVSGQNEGYLDVLISDGGLTVGNEVDGSTFYKINTWKNIGDIVSKGNWHAYEMYAKFSSIPGNAIYRVWQNGKLILEDTTSLTLRSSTSNSDFIYLFSYWNGGAPKTQSAYVDSIVITTGNPVKSDISGNKFVGLSDVAFPPGEPKNIAIE